MYTISISFVLVAIVAYRICLIIYRLFFHPLAAFPGPKLAAVTSLYETYYDVLVPPGGQYMLKLKELHAQYGPVLRITPDDVHIFDPDFHASVFTYQGRWDKHPSYQRFGNPGSHFATVDHYQHKLRKTALAPYFSKTKIKDLEPRIQENVDKLCSRLKGLETSTEGGDIRPIELRIPLGAYTKDTVFSYATGRTAGSLDMDDFDESFMRLVQNIAPVHHLSKQLTWLPTLFNSLPVGIIERIDGAAATQKRLVLSLRKEITDIVKRLRSDKSVFCKGSTHRTIFEEVIGNSLLPEHEASPERLSDELHAMVFAGTDTTAFCLMVTAFHILNNERRHLYALREELSSVPKPWTLQKLEQLPFMTGVILEGFRLSAGSSVRLGRIAPDRPIVYPGTSEIGKGSREWIIPPGTEISMNATHISYDERVWGDDVKDFRPDRWRDPAERKRLSRYLVTFQAGARQCSGMNLAYAELYLAVANLFAAADFEMFLHNASSTDMDILGDHVMPMLRKEVEVCITPKNDTILV